jgi:hypothetical protein
MSFEVSMELDLVRFYADIVEFLSAETLRAIDYGVLDLSSIKDRELREVLYFIEDVLTFELKANYFENDTGIFRVQKSEKGFRYTEFGHVIEAGCISDLKELVLMENRIWYIFDDVLFENLGGNDY